MTNLFDLAGGTAAIRQTTCLKRRTI